ncbi:MAG: hypothetical protein B6244_10080 [Candidatus Cloacimonetes bacterium 4572_55]|nr:MAG: hypothetical protein B6244_10080 [Candidatus Cloacimonetes bacterium 4572_55]
MNRILIMLLMLSTLTGCVYFNTFYNAKKFYKEADDLSRNSSDKPSRQQLDLYDKCIERCARIIQENKKSRYRDDALFLMGKSFLGKQRPDDLFKATNTFEQLIANYPNSKFVDEASLLIGRTYHSQKRWKQALEVFRTTIREYPDRRFATSAQLFIGNIYYEQEEHEHAALEYEKVLLMKRDKDIFRETYAQLGETYYQLGDWSAAFDAYAKAFDMEDDSKQRFYLRFQQGECLLQQEDHERAYDLFKNMLDRAPLPQDKARVKVRIAESNIAFGEDQIAWETLNRVTEENKNSLASNEAYYLMGMMIEQEADYDSAKTLYEYASKGHQEELVTEIAKQKLEEVQKLSQLQKGFEDPERAAETHFFLAELYLLDQELLEPSIQHFYVIIDSFPETAYAPKSYYALAHLLENELDNPDSADVFYGHILERFSETEYADAVRKRFDMPIKKQVYEIPPEPEPVTMDSSVVDTTVAAHQAVAVDSAASEDQMDTQEIAWPQGTMPDSVLTDSAVVASPIDSLRSPAPDSLFAPPPDSASTQSLEPAEVDSVLDETDQIVLPDSLSQPDSASMQSLEPAEFDSVLDEMDQIVLPDSLSQPDSTGAADSLQTPTPDGRKMIRNP